jgi:hypothetical protein
MTARTVAEFIARYGGWIVGLTLIAMIFAAALFQRDNWTTPTPTGMSDLEPHEAIHRCISHFSVQERESYAALPPSHREALMHGLTERGGDAEACAARQKILDLLRSYPLDERDKIFGRMLSRCNGSDRDCGDSRSSRPADASPVEPG